MSDDRTRIPVILDTDIGDDIGDDIDDTWALAMLLKSPEIDLKLVVTDYGNTTFRAKIAAKLLQIAGRTDVGVGIGVPGGDGVGPQGPWVDGYDLDAYSGAVHQDGVGALIEAIMSAPEPITLACIGPMPNIGVALRREPRLAEHARFVGMYGSVRKGYGGAAEPSAEWNVRADVASCRAAFTAPWDVTITPLDTCGIVTLSGEKYAAVRDCRDPVVRALMDNYRIWCRGRDDDPEVASSTLFDTVAAYLAFTDELVTIERLGIRVGDDGMTLVDDEAKRIDCAMEWKDLAAFEDLLVARLIHERA